MGRARTGTLERVTDAEGKVYYRCKVRLADGSRVRREIPEQWRRSETAARDYAAKLQEREDITHTALKAKRETTAQLEALEAGAPGESCDAWYERFMVHRRAIVGSVDDDAWRWHKWVAPRIGPTPIREVTPDDIENIRDDLTAAVVAYEAAGNAKGEGRLAPKTAQNVWAALTTAFKYASSRKGPRELRVREDLGNPCLGIPPPRNGSSKRRHWLRPPEIAAVLACELVPRDWREAIAVGAYLHLRPGELHELRAGDVDLDTGEVRICRAFDEREKVVKVPKTDEGIRVVSVPPALAPLLERLVDKLEPKERLCPVVAATPEKSRAARVREFLRAAGVERAELFVETATHLPIDFRALRDTGITWRFLAEHRAEVVQREAGHEHISTTLGYAKEVQDRRGRYGAPFPELPPSLLGERSTVRSTRSHETTSREDSRHASVSQATRDDEKRREIAAPDVFKSRLPDPAFLPDLVDVTVLAEALGRIVGRNDLVG